MISAELAALEFLIDAGITQAYSDETNNRFKPTVDLDHFLDTNNEKERTAPYTNPVSAPLKAHSDIINQATELAQSCTSLEELKNAIQNFDGLNIRKTATQIVFADGNPKSNIMIIGEAPATEEDRHGKPFVGNSGQLLDKILACIGLDRSASEANKSLYISNILNWRPPGNRTPTKEEIDISYPFIKKHIDLVNPDYLILCGGIAAQRLLNSKDSISRLRGKIHKYDDKIKAIATYHPNFIIKTPLQKKKVWEDMLMLQEALDG